jgi:sigma-B regulation protein RsbU (phosphoserine phosphatase)
MRMEIRSPQNELNKLRQAQKAFRAQNRLFENLIEMVRSASKREMLKTTMQKTLDVACDLSRAEKGSLFLLNEEGVVTDSILTRGEVPSEERLSLIGSVLERGLAGWVRKHLEIGLIEDSKTDNRWLSLPDEPYVVRSALAVPILRHNWLFGILTLMHSEPGHFKQDSIDMMQLTADQMALAIENVKLYMKLDASYRSLGKAKQSIERYSRALDHELEQGRKIQKDFLPHRIPQVPDCEIATYFHPALQLSGDFYDVFILPDHRVGLVIADVSGKGVGSALFMALLRSLIRVFSGYARLQYSIEQRGRETPAVLTDPANVPYADESNVLNAVSLTSEYIAHEHGDEGMFATLFFGIIDPLTGSLAYVNGGHEPLIVLSKDGIKHRLKPTGPAVGMMPGSYYKIETVQLEPGDILFGYTDGVTEARSPQDSLYTRRRFEDAVVSFRLPTAVECIENVKSDLFAFIQNAPQADDITMLAVRYK